MKTTLLFVALVFGCAMAIPIVQDVAFNNWMNAYNKTYTSLEETFFRHGIWTKNMEIINAHNSLGLTYTMAMNEFGDLTHEEFARYYLGVIQPARQVTTNHIIYVDTSALPASVDWRTKGIVTPIKNQGQCGSCWSFSTTGSVEGQHALATGKLVGLSESNLVDCSSGFGNQGCNGGLMDDAFQYIEQCGIDTEASYPYQPVTGTCKYSTTNIGAKITGYTDVTSGSESALQTAVANVGPISVAIDASQSSFQFYSGGVYYEPACSSTQLDHGVLAVGYGTDSGADYWLVKNSWGTSWGLQGYIMMSRNRNNNCGIATMASYPTGASDRLPGDTASCSQSTSSGTSSSTSSSSSSTSSSSTSSSSTGVVANEGGIFM